MVYRDGKFGPAGGTGPEHPGTKRHTQHPCKHFLRNGAKTALSASASRIMSTSSSGG
jgi:hypothetical protein